MNVPAEEGKLGEKPKYFDNKTPGGGCGWTKLHRTSVPPARDDGTSLGQEPDRVISFQGINYLGDNTNINTSVWGWGARFVFF